MASSGFMPLFPLFVIFIIILARRPAIHLRKRGAVSPETAVPLEEMSAGDRRRLDRLMRQGMIKEGAPGLYYYDAEGERLRMKKVMPWLIGLIVLLALIAAAMAWYVRSRHPV